MKKIIVALLIIPFLASCGSRKRIAQSKKKQVEVVVETPPKSTPILIKNESPTISQSELIQNYIKKYSQIAIDEMQQYKIPASITLAQGILESSSGTSELSKRSNNHFGIKCHKSWNGAKTYHDDDKKSECFRVYKNPSYSFKDHSLFLYGKKRYMNLFRLDITDYKGWAKGLRKAGYATDKTYPKKLIKLIEDYQLYKYDAMALEKTVDEIKASKNKTHIVKKGDTLYSISRKYGLTVNELKEINRLETNDIAVGQKLYLTKLE